MDRTNHRAILNVIDSYASDGVETGRPSLGFSGGHGGIGVLIGSRYVY